MRSVFITGGSGTVGASFIELFSKKYRLFSFSRNEKMQVALKRRFPETEIILGAVEDKIALARAVNKVKPDIIIHAAALKHVDTAELSPISAVKSNIVGSLNIIDAAVENNVYMTLAISTDKACCADSNYGYTKALMEKMFLEAHTQKNKFSVCRFGNVTHSHGSVIPFWLGLVAANKTLPLTHKKMNRLMFSRFEAASLIEKAIDKLDSDNDCFIFSQKMKSVNMQKLAELISNDIELVGLRPGEKLDEILVSASEVDRTFVDGKFITIRSYENVSENKILEEYSSKSAEFMSKTEMLKLLTEVDDGLSSTILQNRIY
jgi:UDP-N-acetylglucosamine 4,6-dehydratase